MITKFKQWYAQSEGAQRFVNVVGGGLYVGMYLIMIISTYLLGASIITDFILRTTH